MSATVVPLDDKRMTGLGALSIFLEEVREVPGLGQIDMV